jgi:hypothetical protein
VNVLVGGVQFVNAIAATAFVCPLLAALQFKVPTLVWATMTIYPLINPAGTVTTLPTVTRPVLPVLI